MGGPKRGSREPKTNTKTFQRNLDKANMKLTEMGVTFPLCKHYVLDVGSGLPHVNVKESQFATITKTRGYSRALYDMMLQVRVFLLFLYREQYSEVGPPPEYMYMPTSSVLNFLGVLAFRFQ